MKLEGKLSKAEQALVSLMASNENYLIRRCKKDGVFARIKTDKSGKCPYCNADSPIYKVENQ